jgi:hypothetical protein
MKKKHVIILSICVVLVIVLALVFKINPKVSTSTQTMLTIRYGTSFGHCVGYCEKEIEVTEATTTFTAEGWDANRKPRDPITKQTPTDTKVWKDIIAAVNEETMKSLPGRIGCPDCADGGAEWIEVTQKDGSSQKVLFSKKVEFEYNNPPEELTSMAKVLSAWFVQLADYKIQ